MAQEKKITLGTVNTIMHHKNQLDRKFEEIRQMLSSRDKPLLQDNWTDADAWKLARDLAQMIARIKNFRKTVFNAENPYPDTGTPLEEIRYYNPYFYPEDGASPTEPPTYPLELWTQVLHCGILLVAANPEFCYPTDGTFADLEDLFLGVLRGGGGPVLKFDYILDLLLDNSLYQGRFHELEKLDFGPKPPVFPKPQDDVEAATQENIFSWWQEWEWMRKFPYVAELTACVQQVKSDELHGQAMEFVQWDIGLEDTLRQAIDLYLYQNGETGMADDRYFTTYAMLCRTQKELLAEMASAAAQGT